MLLANSMTKDVSQENLDWTVFKILMICEVGELLNIAWDVIDKIPDLWELHVKVSRPENEINTS